MRLPRGRIYLDCNATTPVAPEALADLQARMAECFANPSSSYREGREAREVLERARGEVAALVGSLPGEVVFTGSGTEANHLALQSAVAGRPGRRRVLMSAIEHPSVIGQRERLEALGAEVEELPVDPLGRLDLPRMDSLMGEDVAMVSLMTAHNETGVLQPVEAAGAACRRWGALFHTDSVQAMGKVASPWGSAGPDYLSVAAHKFYGPKGVAALIVREGAPVHPLLLGGGQERGRRASTEAVALVSAMGVAARLALDGLRAASALAALRDRLEARLVSRFGAVLFGDRAPRLPNTTFFAVPGADAAALVERLDAEGFALSTGSACHTGRRGAAAVLVSMGVSDLAPAGALRVSLGRGTAPEELDAFLEALPRSIGAARV
jgi:cysteine desulfurase